MGFFYKILGKRTEGEKEKLRVGFLKQLLALQQVLIKRPEDYAKKVASDFYFSSVAVSKKDGSLIMTNNGGDDTGSLDFLDAMQARFSDADFFLVKEDDHCNVFYSDDDYVYTFTSPGEISAIEAKAAARSLKSTIEKYRLNKGKQNNIYGKLENQ